MGESIFLSIFVSFLLHLALAWSFGRLNFFEVIHRQQDGAEPVFIAQATTEKMAPHEYKNGQRTRPGLNSLAIRDKANEPMNRSSGGNHPRISTLSSEEVQKQGNLLPSYPTVAVEQGWQGTVRLKLKLSPEGWVTQSEIVESSGYPVLDKTALEASKDWKFKLAPTIQTIIAPIKFMIES
jgi:TonB family protein